MSGSEWLKRMMTRMRPARTRRDPRPDRPLSPDGVPVDPNNRPTLSGGAAAALEFDD